jgi:predicted Zn-dependent protease
MFQRTPRDDYSERRRGKFKIFPLILFGLFMAYYISSNRSTVPITGRSQVVALSEDQEAALGLQAYREVLESSDTLQTGPELDLIRSVGSKLAAVTEKENFDWAFTLIESDQANAFCLPGGKVAVYSGLLPIAKNPDGLAAVLGHEIAHATARHGAERMSHQQLLQFGQIALGAATSDMDVKTQRMVLGALGIGAQFGIMLPYSRDHESEADHIGLIYMAKACFDPREAPKLWERMAEESAGRNPPEFLSTHPAPEARIEQLAALLPEAMKVREEAGCAPLD